MKVRPVDGVKDKNALFLSNRMQRISPKTVQHVVYTFLEKAGLAGQGLSVHKLRHTAATLMYQHGKVDVLVLKEILGHENLGTTEILYAYYGRPDEISCRSESFASAKGEKASSKMKEAGERFCKQCICQSGTSQQYE